MLHLGKCENYGCGEDAIGATDDGDFFCEDCLFQWSCEEEWPCEQEFDLEEGEDFPDAEVELLDTSLFDGER